MIAVAQTLCWISCLCNLPWLHIPENSLWAVLAFALTLQNNPDVTNYLRFLCAIFIIYIVFMDIPLYMGKKNQLISPVEGFSKITSQSKLVTDNKFWQGEFVWMTGYFTFAVWGSLYLAVSK
eukprot:Pgem_evm1s3484